MSDPKASKPLKTTTASAPAPSSVANELPKTFTLFLKLPAELRINILRYFAEDDKVTLHKAAVTMIRRKNDPSRVTFKTLMPIPPLLHLCSESSKEALKNYICCLKTGNGAEESRMVYINPSMTMLVIRLPRRICQQRHSLCDRILTRYRSLKSSLPEDIGQVIPLIIRFRHFNEETLLLVRCVPDEFHEIDDVDNGLVRELSGLVEESQNGEQIYLGCGWEYGWEITVKGLEACELDGDQ